MNNDPVKKIGRIQEQIEMECTSRRNYPRKWSKFYEQTPWKEMYNQNEIDRQIKMESNGPSPFASCNDGDTSFTSPEIAVCRCGRPRSGLHLLRCLQSQNNKYENQQNSIMHAANGGTTNSCSSNKLPETSSGFVGWQNKQNQYKQWENSMKYISPIYDMPGGKITAPSYSSIIIG